MKTASSADWFTSVLAAPPYSASVAYTPQTASAPPSPGPSISHRATRCPHSRSRPPSTGHAMGIATSRGCRANRSRGRAPTCSTCRCDDHYAGDNPPDSWREQQQAAGSRPRALLANDMHLGPRAWYRPPGRSPSGASWSVFGVAGLPLLGRGPARCSPGRTSSSSPDAAHEGTGLTRGRPWLLGAP